MRYLLQAILFVFASLVLAACGTTTAMTPTSSQLGITWTLKSVLPAVPVSVAYSPNNYVIVGGGTYSNYIYSGASASVVPPPAGSPVSNLLDVIWTGNRFISVGTGTIYISSDGVSWNNAAGGQPNYYPYGLISGNGKILAVGRDWNGYTNPVIIISIDNGATWSPVVGYNGAVNTGYFLNGGVWTGTQYVAVGGFSSNITPAASNTGAVLTSPDGVTWRVRATILPAFLYQVAWSGTMLVATGTMGKIFTSTDGITWTERVSGTVKPLGSVKWTGSQFVVVGNTGTVLTSPDGIIWTDRSIPGATNVDFQNVAVSTNQYMAVGNITGTQTGAVYTSP